MTNSKKFHTVIDKNTYYFYNAKFEEAYETYINSIKETLLSLRNRIKNEGLKKELFEELIYEKERGLRALLALNGLSNESLKRLLTFIRIVNNNELDSLILKDGWAKEIYLDIPTKNAFVKEWTDNQIYKHVRSNKYFRKGLINLFFEGATVPILSKVLPPFELKKLSISKLAFNIESLIDTLIRYKEKGSYSGKKENNPEIVIEKILDDLNLPFDRGDLGEFLSNAVDTKRRIDFIIPNKNNPVLLIECSYLVTTSSGQGDKSKTEISVDSLLKQHYGNAHFIGFVDGIGWYVRTNDLKRMVSAYEDVFTFHQEEITRFENYLKKVFDV